MNVWDREFLSIRNTFKAYVRVLSQKVLKVQN